jgi:phenylalanyl-tRNA synthetase beta chain
MKLSYNWLNEFVDLSGTDPKALADLLTMKTCEVEGIEEFMPHLNTVRVAHIDELTKHPDADKLKICKVNVGNEVIQIVTGADNVAQGKKFPVLGVGVTLPDGRTMQKAKLRGVESFGMLGSGSELGLTGLAYAPAQVDGLMALPDAWKTGAPLADYLGSSDIILDIDNKSITHRPDLWCHFGFAREIAALLGVQLKFNPELAKFSTTKSTNVPTIEIEKESAITYCGAEIVGFKVEASPLPRQLRLLSIGQKPINNIVDTSNYVLFEVGQPNHAFDRDKLQGPVRVSYSKPQEKIKLLDGSEHTLPDNLVLIRDGAKPVALAGVMGGAGSETTEATQKLFLESATFQRADIRRTVAKTGIRSDSSQRFEKAQNPEKARAAIFRFAELLAEGSEKGSIQLSEISEVTTKDFKPTTAITISNAFIDQKLGTINARPASNADILRRLNFSVEEKGDTLTVTPPAYRKWFDITIPEDLVEEIGRFIGYKEITIEPAVVACEPPRAKNQQRNLEHELRSLCTERLQLSETLTYAFHSNDDLAVDAHFTDASGALKMQNAINSDLGNLRISPLPGLLRAVHGNYRENANTRLFEIEKLFLPAIDSKLARHEAYFLAGAFTGEKEPADALAEAAGIVAEILGHAGLARHDQIFVNQGHGIFHPGRTGSAGTGEKKVFRLGEVHPRILADFGIKAPVYYFDCLIADLLELSMSEGSTYRSPFTHPAVDFDMTLVMPHRAEFSALRTAAGVLQPLIRRDLDKTVLVAFDYVSTFAGGNLAADQKAVSVRATWRNPTRTLAADEIKKLQEGLIQRMQKAGFTLR